MKQEAESESLMSAESSIDWTGEERLQRYQAPQLRSFRLLAIISMVVNAILLGVVGFAYSTRTTPSPCLCELPTDRLFGHVPWTLVRTNVNETFVDANPEYGPAVGGTNPWDEIFPSSWTALSDPTNLTGVAGIEMAKYGIGDRQWKQDDSGFGLAVMHQVHCVRTLKRTLRQFTESGSTNIPQWHQDHCIEMLRQAVMCHGDLALERPRHPDEFPQEADGWGNVHLCRDQDALMTAIRQHSIIRQTQEIGWVAYLEGN